MNKTKQDVTQFRISCGAYVCSWGCHMLANGRTSLDSLESSWNVDSDRVIGRNFPLKKYEDRGAYFRLLALTKDTRFCKAMA